MNGFTLMHKNKPVAKLSIREDINGKSYLHVHDIVDKNELPYGLKNESEAKMSISLTWWNNNRSIPLGRPNYEKLLQIFSASSSTDLIPYSYMCSLTDCYWFKPEGDDVSWEDVNFRDNNFSSELYRPLFFNEFGKPLHDLNSPDLTTDGALPKMWRNVDGDFYLIKSSKRDVPMDVYNEVIASALMTQMEIPHVDYFLCSMNGITASACRCFIPNNNFEFVQAQNLIYDGYYDTPEEYLNKMREMGFGDAVDSMILIDMVIGNVDEHARNYGQIISSETQKIIQLVPIFDNGGCDLLADVSDIRYKPTGKTFEETTRSLDSKVLARVEKINLEQINALIDSFLHIPVDDKAIIKNVLSDRVSHIIELSRGIEHDFDRDNR